MDLEIGGSGFVDIIIKVVNIKQWSIIKMRIRDIEQIISSSKFTNLKIFGFTGDEIKILVEYCMINQEMNSELIKKLVKFGNYLDK